MNKLNSLMLAVILSTAVTTYAISQENSGTMQEGTMPEQGSEMMNEGAEGMVAANEMMNETLNAVEDMGEESMDQLEENVEDSQEPAK